MRMRYFLSICIPMIETLSRCVIVRFQSTSLSIA